MSWRAIATALLMSNAAGWAQPPEETAVTNGSGQAPIERSTFDFRLGPGRGRISGEAESFEARQRGEVLILSGQVEMRYQDVEVRADLIRVDLLQSQLTAEGNVVLDEGPNRFVGEVLEWNLETRTGSVTDCTAYVDPDVHFSGERIAKVGDGDYTIEQGSFSGCDQRVPDWSLGLSSADVRVGGYARIKNMRLRLKGVPVLYLPYVVWPARTERSSGLLTPRPGYSSRRGGYLGLAYFQTLGRSADTTFFGDLYSREFFGVGQEVRWRPSESSRGELRGYLLSEPAPTDANADAFRDRALRFDPSYEPGDTRWKVDFFHESNGLWGRFRGVIDAEQVSDFDFLQDLERDVRRQTRAFIYSNAYLSSNFGPHSFNLLVDQRERVRQSAEGERDTLRQLPEVEYKVRNLRLGRAPVYFSLDSALHYLSLDRRDIGAEEYGRADLRPTLSFPLSGSAWLSARVDVGGRTTWYGDSLLGTGQGPGLSGDSLTRTFPFADVEVVGPSFARIYDTRIGRFAKIRHLIEPRWTYRYVDLDERDAGELGRVIGFDEIDRVRPLNVGTVSIFNRFLAKPADGGSAFEVASLELARSYSFDSALPLERTITETPRRRSRGGPLIGRFRFNPSSGTSLRVETLYSTLFDDVLAWSLSGSAGIGPHRLGLTWRQDRDPEREDPVLTDQLQLSTKLELVPRRMTFEASVNLDLDPAPDIGEDGMAILRSIRALQERYFVDWHDDCFSVRFEWRESELGGFEDRDFRFSFTLKHVGTFIDLTGSAD